MHYWPHGGTNSVLVLYMFVFSHDVDVCMGLRVLCQSVSGRLNVLSSDEWPPLWKQLLTQLTVCPRSISV